MTPFDSNSERKQIEQAITLQESMRGQTDDALIDPTIATLKEKLAALDDQSEQQRKLANILFLDIAGHTALTRDLDPEDQMALVDPLIARLAGKVTEYGEHVARYQDAERGGQNGRSIWGAVRAVRQQD